MSNIGDVPELAAEWLRTRPQFCATCGTHLPDGLPCVGCEADGWYAEAAAWYAQHRPDARQVSGRWRVDCSCGWRGPVVSLPGHGTASWTEHFAEVQ